VRFEDLDVEVFEQAEEQVDETRPAMQGVEEVVVPENDGVVDAADGNTVGSSDPIQDSQTEGGRGMVEVVYTHQEKEEDRNLAIELASGDALETTLVPNADE